MYDEATLLEAYPVLRTECEQRVDAVIQSFSRSWKTWPRAGSRLARVSLAWGFHLEAINLWVQQAAAREEAFEYVWVLEDDVRCPAPLV